jgi:hypothetical protein
MKSLLIILLSFISITGFSQKLDSIPMKDGKVFYSEVVKVDSATSSELYSRAKNFLAHEYKSAKAVIQVDDKDGGQIVGKGNYNISFTFMLVNCSQLVHHTLSIFVKDGKYKYEISEFIVDVPRSSFESAKIIPIEEFGATKKVRAKALDSNDSIVKDIVKDLKIAMGKPLTSDF